jgi:hypothetical protein
MTQLTITVSIQIIKHFTTCKMSANVNKWLTLDLQGCVGDIEK